MQFDDRLSTVLRKHAGSEAAARTQLRQLLDLLGSSGSALPPALTAEAGWRLAELLDQLPAETPSQILREPGLRLRHPDLVEALAWCEPKIAASAMAMARLSEEEWLALLPRLPVTARGFLRHRRDLQGRVVAQLRQLGVGDLVLSDPGIAEFEAVAARAQAGPAIPLAPPPATLSEPETIAALLHRIEQFRGTRTAPTYAPRLPLGDAGAGEAAGRIEGADLACDAEGLVTWASGKAAPWLVGMMMLSPGAGPLVRFGGAQMALALGRYHPLTNAPLTIAAAPAISGAWRIDATPIFAPGTGSFAGYRARLRRAPDEATSPAHPANTAATAEADQTRELLHELRTPVNAIQGFAEIIQQQLFGPAPHEYRAHAAAIAVDSAKLLAGFDEIDRLARLETEAMELDEGEADLREVVSDTLRRLHGVLEPRGASFDLTVTGSPFTTGMDRGELLQLVWRILATAGGAMAPGEVIALDLIADDQNLRLKLDWPASLRERLADKFVDPKRRPAVTAGMFHPRFTLRLAQAEAQAAGGKFKLGEKRITLTLPTSSPSGTDERENDMAANPIRTQG